MSSGKSHFLAGVLKRLFCLVKSLWPCSVLLEGLPLNLLSTVHVKEHSHKVCIGNGCNA